MINEITLDNLLPEVFAGAENQPPVSTSGVWLRPGVTFSRGSRTLVAAESGTGKSSMCSYIYGARTDYRGRILFDGTDIRTLSTAQWCRLRCHSLAWLPQEMRLFPELSVMENLLVKNRLTDRYNAAELTAMLARLEIDHKVNQPAGRLSVGQQQRVALVRALAQPFDFIILDEPVSHLDARNNAICAALVQEVADAQGAAIIATSVGNHLSLSHSTTIAL